MGRMHPIDTSFHISSALFDSYHAQALLCMHILTNIKPTSGLMNGLCSRIVLTGNTQWYRGYFNDH